MSAPAPNFNRIARAYRWMEYLSFGRALERCRFRFLPQLASASAALVLGDGDGRFTARLLATCPALHVYAVDASPAMLHLLQARAAPAADRLKTHCADLRHLTSGVGNGPYDLVATHFFLDCLTSPEIETLLERIAPHLSPGAFWLVSEFAIPPAGSRLRLGARGLVAALYAAFRVLTGLRVRRLPDHAAIFTRSGFTLRARQPHLRGILVSELWQAHATVPGCIAFP